MGVPEIRSYLSHLAIDKNMAASTQNVARNALLFLYQKVLQIGLPFLNGIEPAKRPQRVPVVFTSAEVKGILASLEDEYHLMASLLYGSGLRLTECLNLRIKDIDFEYRQITVRSVDTPPDYTKLRYAGFAKSGDSWFRESTCPKPVT
jgi:integrase